MIYMTTIILQFAKPVVLRFQTCKKNGLTIPVLAHFASLFVKTESYAHEKSILHEVSTESAPPLPPLSTICYYTLHRHHWTDTTAFKLHLTGHTIDLCSHLGVVMNLKSTHRSLTVAGAGTTWTLKTLVKCCVKCVCVCVCLRVCVWCYFLWGGNARVHVRVRVCVCEIASVCVRDVYSWEMDSNKSHIVLNVVDFYRLCFSN